jgi:mRNA interferase YafQ
MGLLAKIIRKLADGEPLPAENRDHQLKGRMSKYRECHISGNWLLVYRYIEDKLVLSLHGVGTHSDLFG